MKSVLKNIPFRTEKLRDYGLTMVMDKGLSCREIDDVVSSAGHLIDIVKLGFGTSYVCANLEEKLKTYKSAQIPTYFGGTLFEAFVIRGQFEDYLRILDKYKMEYVEVSDGSMNMPHDEKCKYIYRFEESHKFC